MNKKYKYHYFYKITNLINNHFYYGVHNTDNLDDGYMGSGKRLHYAYKKYGIENFSKEIIKFFDSSEEAYNYESEIVNEYLIKDNNCYNIQLGGKGFNTSGLVTVKDKFGNYFDVYKDDPRYLSKELVGVTKGFVTAKDKNGKCYYVSITDERYLNGELIHPCKDLVIVKDSSNRFFMVEKNNPKYLSGELKPSFYNKKHKKESLIMMKTTMKNNNHQQGEKNSQYGTCWIHNDKENKKIKKEELIDYINNGWIKGRKMKFD